MTDLVGLCSHLSRIFVGIHSHLFSRTAEYSQISVRLDRIVYGGVVHMISTRSHNTTHRDLTRTRKKGKYYAFRRKGDIVWRTVEAMMETK